MQSNCPRRCAVPASAARSEAVSMHRCLTQSGLVRALGGLGGRHPLCVVHALPARCRQHQPARRHVATACSGGEGGAGGVREAAVTESSTAAAGGAAAAAGEPRVAHASDADATFASLGVRACCFAAYKRRPSVLLLVLGAAAHVHLVLTRPRLAHLALNPQVAQPFVDFLKSQRITKPSAVQVRRRCGHTVVASHFCDSRSPASRRPPSPCCCAALMPPCRLRPGAARHSVRGREAARVCRCTVAETPLPRVQPTSCRC